jgi:hypothetical protein
METHLTHPLLAFYRSQHVNQNWLAALTAIVDVAAFIKAEPAPPAISSVSQRATRASVGGAEAEAGFDGTHRRR